MGQHNVGVPGHPVRLDPRVVEMARFVAIGRNEGVGETISKGILRWLEDEYQKVLESRSKAWAARAGEAPAKRRTPEEREMLKSKVHDLHRAELTQRAIAATLNVSVGTVNKILQAGKDGRTGGQADGRPGDRATGRLETDGRPGEDEE